MIKTLKVLFFIIVIITCIILGLWQIDRANEKAYLYHAFNERISKNPIQFEVIKSNPVDFTKIIITGTYISNKQFLLDNKIFNIVQENIKQHSNKTVEENEINPIKLNNYFENVKNGEKTSVNNIYCGEYEEGDKCHFRVCLTLRIGYS